MFAAFIHASNNHLARRGLVHGSHDDADAFVDEAARSTRSCS
jgi:hypothetical protein